MAETQIFQVSEFLEEFRKDHAELQEKAKRKLYEVFREFWEMNPGIGTVTWDQYAPHFNDGDACIFSVHDPDFSNFDKDQRDMSAVKARRRQALLASLSEEDKELLGISLTENPTDAQPKEEWTYESYAFSPRFGSNHGPKDMTGINCESVVAISTFLQSGPMEEALKMTFGEDCTVRATRSGFAVTECEHD